MIRARWAVAAALLALAAPAFAARDVMLVLDNSGSMQKNDPSRLAVESVTQFIDSQPTDTRVGVIVFATTAELAVPLAPVSAGMERTLARRLDYRGRWTQTAAAVERALYELRQEGRPDADKAIVLMTDGLIDTGDKNKDAELETWLRNNLAQQAVREKVRIFGIAFTEAADYELLQSLATATDGDYFRVLVASGIGKTLERINLGMARAGSPPAMRPAAVAAPRAVAPPARPSPVPGPGSAEEPGLSGTNTVIAVVVGLMVAGPAGFIFWRRRRRAGASGFDAGGPRAVLRDLASPFADRQVGGKQLVIGRKAGTDPKRDYLVLAEASVGRWHATVERRGLTFYLRDEGSVNGTYLNGERIKGEEALKHNDLIRIHSHNFQFLIPDLEDSDRTVLVSQ